MNRAAQVRAGSGGRVRAFGEGVHEEVDESSGLLAGAVLAGGLRDAAHREQDVVMAEIGPQCPVPRARTTSAPRSWGPDMTERRPMLTVFHRDGEVIRHFWRSELFYAPVDPGQDPRRVGTLGPLWNLFDLTPEGRRTGTSKSATTNSCSQESLPAGAPPKPCLHGRSRASNRRLCETRAARTGGRE